MNHWAANAANRKCHSRSAAMHVFARTETLHALGTEGIVRSIGPHVAVAAAGVAYVRDALGVTRRTAQQRGEYWSLLVALEQQSGLLVRGRDADQLRTHLLRPSVGRGPRQLRLFRRRKILVSGRRGNPITAEQAQQIREVLRETGASESALLTKLGVTSIEDIRGSVGFKRALSILEKDRRGL